MGVLVDRFEEHEGVYALINTLYQNSTVIKALSEPLPFILVALC
jgi:hypothetical protein